MHTIFARSIVVVLCVLLVARCSLCLECSTDSSTSELLPILDGGCCIILIRISRLRNTHPFALRPVRYEDSVFLDLSSVFRGLRLNTFCDLLLTATAEWLVSSLAGWLVLLAVGHHSSAAARFVVAGCRNLLAALCNDKINTWRRVQTAICYS